MVSKISIASKNRKDTEDRQRKLELNGDSGKNSEEKGKEEKKGYHLK